MVEEGLRIRARRSAQDLTNRLQVLPEMTIHYDLAVAVAVAVAVTL